MRINSHVKKVFYFHFIEKSFLKTLLPFFLFLKMITLISNHLILAAYQFHNHNHQNMQKNNFIFRDSRLSCFPYQQIKEKVNTGSTWVLSALMFAILKRLCWPFLLNIFHKASPGKQPWQHLQSFSFSASDSFSVVMVTWCPLFFWSLKR